MVTKTAGQQSYHDRKQSYASVRLEPDSEKGCLAPDCGWGKKCAKGGLQECIQVPPNLGGLAGLWGTKSTEEVSTLERLFAVPLTSSALHLFQTDFRSCCNDNWHVKTLLFFFIKQT